MIRLLCMGLLVAVPLQGRAAPPVVTVATALDAPAAYAAISGNTVRCWADGEFSITAHPATPVQPGKIVIDGRWGHRFAVVDIAPGAAGAAVAVTLTYKLGRKRRSEEWRRAIQDWTSPASSAYCPRMP